MNTNLLKVSLRQNAIYLSTEGLKGDKIQVTPVALNLLSNLKKMGYTVSEQLLHAINNMTPKDVVAIYNTMKDLLGMNLNWAPLVKGWDKPTGETLMDHLFTAFVNAIGYKKGLTLPCGHLIIENTFPIERYNGCPFCGTPFQLSKTKYVGQGSKLKVLDLWTETDLEAYFKALLESRTALDATQADSLKILLDELSLPDVEIEMKETQILVLDNFVSKSETDRAMQFLKSPTDILRYLWFKHTGSLQIVEPKTIIKRTAQNNAHICYRLDKSQQVERSTKEALKLKYSRTECRMVATWFNKLDMDVEKICEAMHPKRGMWVRFIRGLRLAEYARKSGFDQLREIMDVFYNQVYTVFQGEVDQVRLKGDPQKTFELLKQRPGLFARSLFANMLWFGGLDTIVAFAEVKDKVPARLLFTLSMYAPTYFDAEAQRVVKPLGGTSKLIGANQLVGIYADSQLKEMVSLVEDLCITSVKERFAKIPTQNKTMYIDPMLFNIPLSIGDRSETVQDISCALMGTRFPVEGSAIRLFMQWGKGLPAQDLDMDLSCHIAWSQSVEICSYYNLTATGAKHSGDIRSIPNKVGTAEYIELDINELRRTGAEYVTFTCNAYSSGSISPNLVVGWMQSANKMKISESTGVAYDPSCVQHQVRISKSLLKGLVFGVLDVQKKEIIWLEVPFTNQTIRGLDVKTVNALLSKLNSKMTIGNLLTIKAESQDIQIIEDQQADEVYNMQWAMNTAEVTKLFVD